MDIIRFKDDWLRFPSAIVDTKTSNESFLKMAHFYKSVMKVENWAWPLALLQPALQGIDPFDPELSDELKIMIALECKYNPWYYFREVARLPPSSGSVPIQFRANRGNLAMFWSFFNNVDFAFLTCRQLGKSASADVLMNGLLFIWCENTPVTLVTKDAKLRLVNIRRLKEIRDLLPSYMYSPDVNDTDNNEGLTNVRLGNRYIASIARNDKIAADRLNRGNTSPIYQFDEFAYLSLIEISLPVSLAAATAARELAEEQNQPYGNLYTTTPGDITSRDGAYAYKFLTSGATWDEQYLDLPDKRSFQLVIERNSTGIKPLIHGSFNHRQMGYSDMWLYNTMRQAGSTGINAEKDYLMRWPEGDLDSPLTDSIKNQIKASETEPLYMDIHKEGFALRWYVDSSDIPELMATKQLVLGLDSSELFGEGNDGSALVLIDPETHNVIMTGRFNTANIQTFATFIGNLLIRYKNITFIPERKSTGSSIIDIVILMLHGAGEDPFKRIFNRIVQESNVLESAYREINSTPIRLRQPTFYDQYKRYFGYATSGAGVYSRTNLYHDGLLSAMEYGANGVKDRTLAMELLGLKIRNGRIDHSTGNHDDMVIALLLCHWLCIKGQNLIYYGINPLSIFSKARIGGKELSLIEQHKLEEQKVYRKEFDDLLESLQGETNPLVVCKIEMRLRYLSRLVDTEELDGIGIDALIRQTREDRNKRSRLSRLN